VVTPSGGESGRRFLRVATRGSPLALWQARRVAERLAELPGAPQCEFVVVQTTGDALAHVPVAQLGGQGAFVKEVQVAVLDPRDGLVGCTLEGLPTGATVATGSVRRRAQLAWLRPDLTFCDLRGNMATRLDRARAVGAGVLALAALERLGLTEYVAEALDPRTLLPQVGQGALGVECRAGDRDVRELLAAVDDPGAHSAVLAERAFLAALGGGCTLPLGALAVLVDGGAHLSIDGCLASRDGRILLRKNLSGPASEPVQLGRRLAGVLLDDCGGRWLDDWADHELVVPDGAGR
jgi:hydroxymethylbilane synthase